MCTCCVYVHGTHVYIDAYLRTCICIHEIGVPCVGGGENWRDIFDEILCDAVCLNIYLSTVVLYIHKFRYTQADLPTLWKVTMSLSVVFI